MRVGTGMSDANTTALAKALSSAMGEIHQRGWCDGTGGNFSCVLSQQPLRLLMAPSGVHKGSVAPRDLIQVDGEGHVLSGQGKASAETALHLEIIKVCGAGAVLHTHSQAGTLLSQWAIDQAAGDGRGALELKSLEMLKGLEGVKTHDCSVFVPALANDQDLSALSSRANPLLADAPHGLLIAGHGLYAWGRNLGSAMRHLEILEFLLEQRWRQLLLAAITAR
jgi:methylthioribulose-1-phosphate dehydratase